MVAGTGIRLGEILVQDLNHNNFYDPGIDDVTDLSGKALKPWVQAQGLAKLQRELKIVSWRGIFLDRASHYLQLMRKAEGAAEQGEWDATIAALGEAQAVFVGQPGTWDQARADKIMERSLIRGVQVLLKNAEEKAQRAEDPERVRLDLDMAAHYDKELFLGFKVVGPFDPARAGQILETGYRNKIDALILKAEKLADEGDIEMTRSQTLMVDYYVQEALNLLGSQVGPAPRDLDRILARAMVNGMPQEYEKTEAEARSGNTQVVRRLLKYIKGLVDEAQQHFGSNLTFDATRADTILETALIEGIEDNFQRAIEARHRGQDSRAEDWLNLARDYVQEYNRDHAPHSRKAPLRFDENRARIILTKKY